MKPQYFPAESLGKTEALPESDRERYTEILAEFNEPSLWKLCEDARAECYRFLWLRTFHPAVCIRIDVTSKGTGELTKKIGTGECGFNGVGPLTLDKLEWLTKEDVAKFRAQLQIFKMWDEPTLDGSMGLDGAQWIFEAVKEDTYHVVGRWSPKDGPVRTIGLKMMIDLAKLKLLYEEVY